MWSDEILGKQFFKYFVVALALDLFRVSSNNGNCPARIGTWVRLRGDTAKAKAAYQDFLTLWKDADSGLPLLASYVTICAQHSEVVSAA